MTLAKVDVATSGKAVQEALGHDEIEPLIITRNGKPVAALLPLDEEDYESIALSLNPEFMAMIERSRRSFEKDGGISFEEMQRRLEQEP
jgi:PHD/YefM family antitoxin component YafN of YafNO toxin-antitoxin module